jgi:hypothetical protein
VRPDEEADPRRFFDETDRSGKRNWKVQQLCKQVERAAAVTLAGECEAMPCLARPWLSSSRRQTPAD